VALTLASIDLLLLCLMALSLGLLETPVPRVWAGAAVALLTVQTGAMHAMGLEADPGAPRSDAIIHSLAEAVAVLVVPAGTAALLTVIFFHCARAYARARRRLEATQAIGRDMPTG
jgi:hypothetical protein